MTRPLDYRNAKGPGWEGDRGAAPRAAIPVEFDAAVTRTEDHAAARVIEDELTRQQIPVFRAEEDAAARREVVLYVRGADRGRAEAIAAEIFVRRKRLRSLPRQEVPKFPPLNDVD